MGRKMNFVGGAALVAAAFSLAGAAPVMAATPVEENSSCWADGVTGESLCVEEGEDLVATVLKERGVQILAPTGAIIAGVPFEQPTAQRSAAARSGTVVGILYDDINYGGGTFVMTGNADGCTTGTAYGYVSLSGHGWNDRASSMRGYQGCKTAVWELENYIGGQFGYLFGTYHLGALNDKASSWRVAP